MMLWQVKYFFSRPSYFLLGLVAVTAFYLPILTNFSGPGGNDGVRVQQNINFINKIQDIYPLWNPYKLGGMPYFSNPETFSVLGYLLNVSDSNFYLFFNLSILGLIFLIYAGVYLFLKHISNSREIASLGGTVFCISSTVMLASVVGRIYGFANIGLGFLSLFLYVSLSEKSRPLAILVSSLIYGLCVSLVGYYALFFPFAFSCVIGVWMYYERGDALIIAIQKSIIDFVLIGLFSIALYFVFIAPLLYYNMQLLTVVNQKPFLQGHPHPGSLLNLFFPIETDGIWVQRRAIFPHMSLIVLPGVALFLSNAKALKKKLSVFVLILAGGSLLVGLGKNPLLEPIISLYDSLPIISHISHVTPFMVILSACILYMAGYGLMFVDAQYKKVSLVSALILGFSWFIDVSYSWHLAKAKGVSWSHYSYFSDHMLSIVMWSALYFALLYFICNKSKYGIPRGVVILFLCSYNVFLVPNNLDKSRLGNLELRTTHMNAEQKATAHFFEKQKGDYFRLYCKEFDCLPIDTTLVQGFHGYSTYFSNEHRLAMSNALEREVTEQRPSHVDMPDCNALNEVWIEMHNIKYAFCLIASSETWRRVEGVSGLYEFVNYKSGIKVFDKWNKKDIEEWSDVSLSWENGEVIIESDLNLEETQTPLKYEVLNVKLKENSHNISVSTNKKAVLFVPEYYEQGWSVSVNGKNADVLRLFKNFRGVIIDVGQNDVMFMYQPKVVKYAALVSMISWVLILLCILTLIYRRRIRA